MFFLLQRDASHGSSYSRTLVAIIWTTTSVATLTLCARLYVRSWRFARFYWDDFFVILGWAFSVPLAAQATIAAEKEETMDYGGGNLFTSRPIVQLFFYTCLWSVKISFLIFFKRIGACMLPRLKKYWTGVLIFTVLMYLGLWAINPYDCWVQKGMEYCSTDANAARIRQISLGLATTLDVLTDCLIIVIPFSILSNIRLSTRQKIILYALFSLEALTMIVAIVRCVTLETGVWSNAGSDFTLLFFLTHVEASTAIIVACSGALRSLFTQEHSSRPQSTHSLTLSAPLRGNYIHNLSTGAIINKDAPCSPAGMDINDPEATTLSDLPNAIVRNEPARIDGVANIRVS